jgi:hypothetical protein
MSEGVTSDAMNDDWAELLLSVLNLVTDLLRKLPIHPSQTPNRLLVLKNIGQLRFSPTGSLLLSTAPHPPVGFYMLWEVQPSLSPSSD